ncbi:hypothetical protein QBC42DRAFT_256483 [Cladorrhinum samala]|uniref:SRR1-like domain-containing protein n=1 Tax=Cladorrhinum samala TaxID=585594 RepID=A0AAV9HB37_9PEZI|nr:hypothetical protein QBC42DRAFT_256483 [Cladorrhinum samala]
MEEGKNEAILNVRRLYDAGVPFFTKDALRRMASLQETVKGTMNEKVLLVGLEGRTAEFPTMGGKISPNQYRFLNKHNNIGVERVWKSRIRYATINDLIRTDDPCGTLPPDEDLYFPLTFGYFIQHRIQDTKVEIHEDPTLVQLPLHLARKNFERERALFQRGEQVAKLRSVLDPLWQSNQLPTVKKVVAFACAGVAWKDDLSAVPSRQHALALFVRDYFAERQGSEVQCFAQEPTYNDVDREILEDAAVGFKVLEDPWGFVEVDDETAVLAFAPNVAVRQIVADLARPALMFWNTGWDPEAHDAQGLDPSSSIVPSNSCSTDPMAPRLGNMLKGYWEHPLTEDEDHTFHESAMYIRKPKGAAEEGANYTTRGFLFLLKVEWRIQAYLELLGKMCYFLTCDQPLTGGASPATLGGFPSALAPLRLVRDGPVGKLPRIQQDSKIFTQNGALGDKYGFLSLEDYVDDDGVVSVFKPRMAGFSALPRG